MDYFKLTRAFWDFAFENPEKIKPNHCALYLFIVEHCNRLGWKHKFGLPTTMAKDAIGIRNYNTYITTLNELVEFGLIILIEKSKNQYSSNIVAISNFDKAVDKALDKALIKHGTKQSESTIQSIDSINKQNTNIPSTNLQEESDLLNSEILPINNQEEKIKKVAPKKESETITTTPEFLEVWNEYKDYRVAKKKTFKFAGLRFEQMAFNKFFELSKGNIQTAKKILEQTIVNNWEGLFDLKETITIKPQSNERTITKNR